MSCIHCFRLREEAKELISATTEKANRTQTDVTERLGERVQDVSYWKFELERAIQDITSEKCTVVQMELASPISFFPPNLFFQARTSC